MVNGSDDRDQKTIVDLRSHIRVQSPLLMRQVFELCYLCIPRFV